MPMLTLTASGPLDHHSIEALLREQVARFAEPAAIWSRLYYDHAALDDTTLKIVGIQFHTLAAGTVRVGFDWVIQDGCSDICRPGNGFVELSFCACGAELQLEWKLPYRRDTADEF